MTNRHDIFISVVVPAFNEEDTVYPFYERTKRVLDSLEGDYEILFVNDGSMDRTAENVQEINLRDRRVKLINLSRNFGKEIAMTAGIEHAAGAVVVLIDADLQDPPEIIPAMVKKWREGYDVVYATRIGREGETLLKKATARAFYWVIRRMAKIDIPENTGDFRLMSQRAVDALKLLHEQHRFMKGLFAWIGFRQTGIPYQREPRFAGSTKWSYWRLWNFAIEGITSFSMAPLKLASYLGALVALFAFAYAVFLVVRVFLMGIDVPGYASIMVAILFFSGVQLLTLGIIGEYIGRMFNETKRRPLYLIQQMVGVENGKPNTAYLRNEQEDVEPHMPDGKNEEN